MIPRGGGYLGAALAAGRPVRSVAVWVDVDMAPADAHLRGLAYYPELVIGSAARIDDQDFGLLSGLAVWVQSAHDTVRYRAVLDAIADASPARLVGLLWGDGSIVEYISGGGK